MGSSVIKHQVSYSLLVLGLVGACKPVSKSTRTRSGEVPANTATTGDSTKDDSIGSTGSNEGTSGSDDSSDDVGDTDGTGATPPKREDPPPAPPLPGKITAMAVAPTGITWVRFTNTNGILKKGGKYTLYFGSSKKFSRDDCKRLGNKLESQLVNETKFVQRLKPKSDEIVVGTDFHVCLFDSKDELIAQETVSPVGEDPDKQVAADPPIVNYGRRCHTEIGQIPAMNCLEGDILPVRVNGQVPNTYASEAGPCDEPAILPLGDGVLGQCPPHSRVVIPETYDPDVQLVMVCRRYKLRTKDSPLFDDVSIIHHRISTGATCFFQMPEEDDPKDATRVPPPNELPKDTPSGQITADKFWLPPREAALRYCINCHDSDPFIMTPMVAGVKNMPRDPFGKYLIVGKEFAIWPIVKSIDTTADNKCTECHRIGSVESCGDTLMYSAGRFNPTGLSDYGKAFPQSHWMPPDHGKASAAEWNGAYQADFDAIRACCQNPNGSGCKVSNISENMGY